MRNSVYFLSLLFFLTSCSPEELTAHKPEQPLYLDVAASWDVSNASLAEFVEISRRNGNSSGINAHAKHLKNLEGRATKVIADKIGAFLEQIHFTSGATAANNIAILGVAYKNPQCHLITSKIEHKSVLNVFKHLEKIGYKVTYLDVDKHGNVNLKQLRKCIQNDTKLISIQMFNSEIGVLQKVKEVGKIAKSHGILFHCDAAQSFCKYDIHVNDTNIDLLTISGHKIGAPKGIGALYVRDSSKLQAITFGSGDELCPGTKPTALICCFAKAVERFKIDQNIIKTNFGLFVSELLQIENIYINSITPSHIVSVSIEGVLLVDILEHMKEYSFSAGCSCLGQDRSNVIAVIDPEDKLPTCTIRISFSDKVSEKQLIDFARKLKSVVEQLRKEKSVGRGCESMSDNSKKDLQNSLDKIQELIKNGGQKKLAINNQTKSERKISDLSKEYGLFFFFRKDCPACKEFAPVVKSFCDKYGWNVIAISESGEKHELFAKNEADKGLVEKWEVNEYPSLLAVNPKKELVTKICQRAMSLEELENRISEMLE